MSDEMGKTVSQVEKQTNLLFSQIETLHTELNTLRERLNRVLRASEPKAEVDSKEIEELVPLAETIRDATASVKNLASSVRDILERLEL